MKPLFIPLRAKHFNAFKDGSKTVEFRAYGPRWNENTCRPGREAILSLGYGKKHRIKAVVVGIVVRVFSTPGESREEWAEIYGDTLGAGIAINLKKEE